MLCSTLAGYSRITLLVKWSGTNPRAINHPLRRDDCSWPSISIAYFPMTKSISRPSTLCRCRKGM